MNNLKESLVEYFLVLSKKLIIQSGLTLEQNCENSYRQLLLTGINPVLQNKLLITPQNEADFFRSQDFLTMEINIIRFVSGWINDAREHNENTLHESTLDRIKEWFDKTFCPGFIPFC